MAPVLSCFVDGLSLLSLKLCTLASTMCVKVCESPGFFSMLILSYFSGSFVSKAAKSFFQQFLSLLRIVHLGLSNNFGVFATQPPEHLDSSTLV